MEILKVKFKRLTPDAVIPHRAHPTDAGYDLTAVWWEQTDDGCQTYHTGIAVEIPEGYVGYIFPRSSLCKYDLTQTNSVGVIDSGFRNEILVKFKPILKVNDYGDVEKPLTLKRYHIGDRIGQLIIMPVPTVDFVESEELSPSDRGMGGHGSTGK